MAAANLYFGQAKKPVALAPECADYMCRAPRVNLHTAFKTCSIWLVTSSIGAMPSTDFSTPFF